MSSYEDDKRRMQQAELERLKRDANDPYNETKWVERERIEEIRRQSR